MPRQNRVTPDGQIVASPARGTFMGNRGILHNDRQEVVKPFAHKAWIICQLSFKGRQRQLMQPGKYTELFFLDEATALAAGHRPQTYTAVLNTLPNGTFILLAERPCLMWKDALLPWTPSGDAPELHQTASV